MSSSDVVWAKMRYCSYWPARIIDQPPIGIKKNPKKCCVFFFGTSNYGFVEIKNVMSYVQHRQKFASKGRGKFFAEAVMECDDFICNPGVSNDAEMRVEVMVKTELGFQVKQESQHDTMWASELVAVSQNAQASRDCETKCQSCEDKDCKIAVLVSEKEKLIFDQNSMRSLFDLKVKNINDQNESLHNEIERLKTQSRFIEEQHNVDQNRIAALLNQVEALQTKLESLKSKHNNEFEVDQLLAHKKQKGQMVYLVRWKGYGKEYDTWEKGDNLSCPKILNAYKKSKNII